MERQLGPQGVRSGKPTKEGGLGQVLPQMGSAVDAPKAHRGKCEVLFPLQLGKMKIHVLGTA